MSDMKADRPLSPLGRAAASWLTSEADKMLTILRGAFTDAAGREKLWNDHQARYTRRFMAGFDRDTP